MAYTTRGWDRLFLSVPFVDPQKGLIDLSTSLTRTRNALSEPPRTPAPTRRPRPASPSPSLRPGSRPAQPPPRVHHNYVFLFRGPAGARAGDCAGAPRRYWAASVPTRCRRAAAAESCGKVMTIVVGLVRNGVRARKGNCAACGLLTPPLNRKGKNNFNKKDGQQPKPL